MTAIVDTPALRKFGLLVGGIFASIGALPLVSLKGMKPHLAPGGQPRLWALGLGATLIVLGLVLPAALRLPHRAWMTVGEALGWVNARIILGVVFFGLFTPMAVFRRFLGKDGLSRKLDPKAETYRVVREPAPTASLSNPF